MLETLSIWGSDAQQVMINKDHVSSNPCYASHVIKVPLKPGQHKDAHEISEVEALCGGVKSTVDRQRARPRCLLKLWAGHIL